MGSEGGRFKRTRKETEVRKRDGNKGVDKSKCTQDAHLNQARSSQSSRRKVKRRFLQAKQNTSLNYCFSAFKPKTHHASTHHHTFSSPLPAAVAAPLPSCSTPSLRTALPARGRDERSALPSSVRMSHSRPEYSKRVYQSDAYTQTPPSLYKPKPTHPPAAPGPAWRSKPESATGGCGQKRAGEPRRSVLCEEGGIV